MHFPLQAEFGLMVCVVENLTLRTWFLILLRRLRGNASDKNARISLVYAVDYSPLLLWFSGSMRLLTGVEVKVLDFRLVDVRDEEGLLLRLRVAYQDAAEALGEVMTEPLFQEFLASEQSDHRLKRFVSKRAMTTSNERQTLWRVLLLVQIAAWKMRESSEANRRPILIIENRPWFRALKRYAGRFGVNLEEVSPSIHLPDLLVRWLGHRGTARLVWLRENIYHLRFASRKGTGPTEGSQFAVESPKVAVQYSGHLNLAQPGYYSDLFFWQESALQPTDLLLCHGLPQDPIDKLKLAELKANDIAAVALYSRATEVPGVPLFSHWPRPSEPGFRATHSRVNSSLDRRWLRQQIDSYYVQRDYWEALCRAYNVRVFVSWYRFDEKHCAVADAVERVGGVTAIYQRAIQPDPAAEIAVDADLMFGYSPFDAQVERRSGSTIPYHVAVGYFGDHRTALLTEDALRVRKSLMNQGATYILAYFDENSGSDSRWHTGHEFMRENYRFLLEKVLREPWLGLVLKPKVSSTLRDRLGPVRALLEQATETGRCYVFEADQRLHGSRPPLEAALASDLAVHGHLCAATAGLEAALAGVPTLLLDREGWHRSYIYGLGLGRVVFTNWTEMWSAIVDHRSAPGGVPGLGDWSPMIEELDPFRDGRAAERMGTYILWLIDGFKAGLNRDRVLMDAAQRYASRWGEDKVNSVDGSEAKPKTLRVQESSMSVR
jgi:hypothetical protein